MAWAAAGIAPAFSPGAGGPSCASISSPADYMDVFASTAHDESRVIASFAGRGEGRLVLWVEWYVIFQFLWCRVTGALDVLPGLREMSRLYLTPYRIQPILLLLATVVLHSMGMATTPTVMVISIC
jgi:hypothetical protein